jgi:hypothetical protein
MKRHAVWVGLLAALAGCQENLTLPGGCPDLCPGGQPQLRDTVLVALPGRDSAFVGYSGWLGVPFLLASTGPETGEARAWWRFERRPDSVFVPQRSELLPFTVDSVALEFHLAARDSTVGGLTLFYHHLPLEVDTLSTLEWVNAHMTEATLIDSLVVPDTLRRGIVRLVLAGDALERFARDSTDTNTVAVGLRLRANEPTGIRVTALGGGGVASYVTYVHVEVEDTLARRQQLTTVVSANGYAREDMGVPDNPDLLFVGRIPAARSIVRFELPEMFRDPRLQVVRATLELQPDEPMRGLRHDPAELVVYGLARDFGPKSPPIFPLRASARLPVGQDTPVGVNVFGIVEVWRRDRLTPPSVVLSLSPEGGTFQRPVFRSTRSPSGAPRLRITWVLPSAVEQP